MATKKQSTERDSKGRFVPGKSPNPRGRPKGSTKGVSVVRLESELRSKGPVAFAKVEELAKKLENKQEYVQAIKAWMWIAEKWVVYASELSKFDRKQLEKDMDAARAALSDEEGSEDDYDESPITWGNGTN